MIGGGPLEKEFGHWLADTERTHPVRLRGTLPWPSVQEAYDDADVFVLTSLRDTDGIQLLEAMAHALPIVTLDHQGAAELVPSDAGIKVAVTTPAATAQGVARALERLAASADLRRTMGAAGYRRARQFPLSRRAAEIETLYTSVTSADQHPADQPSSDSYGALNAEQTESEVDDFTAERYRQFSRYLPCSQGVAGAASDPCCSCLSSVPGRYSGVAGSIPAGGATSCLHRAISRTRSLPQLVRKRCRRRHLPTCAATDCVRFSEKHCILESLRAAPSMSASGRKLLSRGKALMLPQ
jgi:hypothetical protein